MRKPVTIENLYLDFDGFFASVEQQAYPVLRGKPVGVVPFGSGRYSSVIACSKEAKKRGVKNVMKVDEARKICPDLILTPQSPDLYRRAHNALLREISTVLPIEVVKSIDELSCKLDDRAQNSPEAIADMIKNRLRQNIGPYITCSIGFAANRQLAKIACKMDKPDGVTIWHPKDMPAPLLATCFDDIPGIGRHMQRRLYHAGIRDVASLLKTSPKQLRKIWGNVTGERLWYALHGYAIHALPSQRNMFGHGRVLPPDTRKIDDAHYCSRLLLTKAARRLRRGGFYSSRLWLWLSIAGSRYERSGDWAGDWGDHSRRQNREGGSKGWSRAIPLPCVQDDQACLSSLEALWQQARREISPHSKIKRLGVTLLDLTPVTARQLDLFLNDDQLRQKWERLTKATDHLNNRYGKTVLSLGIWNPPKGGNVGGKISYTRIPKAEDFW